MREVVVSTESVSMIKTRPIQPFIRASHRIASSILILSFGTHSRPAFALAPHAAAAAIATTAAARTLDPSTDFQHFSQTHLLPLPMAERDVRGCDAT